MIKAIVTGHSRGLGEALAAALLQLADWDGSEPLLDPTCGSGTLVIEAALLAAGRAPGRHRSFAFQSWPTFVPALWSARLAAADAAVRPVAPGLLYAADLDPEATALARRNATRVGVESLISWSVADLSRSQLPAGPPGLVLANPPYGVRLHTPQRLYRDLGRLARSRDGWRLGVLTSDPQLARAAGPFTQSHCLHSGGLRVTLYLRDPSAAAKSTSAAAPSGVASIAPYFLKIRSTISRHCRLSISAVIRVCPGRKRCDSRLRLLCSSPVP